MNNCFRNIQWNSVVTSLGLLCIGYFWAALLQKIQSVVRIDFFRIIYGLEGNKGHEVYLCILCKHNWCESRMHTDWDCVGFGCVSRKGHKSKTFDSNISNCRISGPTESTHGANLQPTKQHKTRWMKRRRGPKSPWAKKVKLPPSAESSGLSPGLWQASVPALIGDKYKMSVCLFGNFYFTFTPNGLPRNWHQGAWNSNILGKASKHNNDSHEIQTKEKISAPNVKFPMNRFRVQFLCRFCDIVIRFYFFFLMKLNSFEHRNNFFQMFFINSQCFLGIFLLTCCTFGASCLCTQSAYN